MGDAPTWESGQVWVLDGGLSTALLERGASLDPQLWTGGVLLDAPEQLAEVARAFVSAGAGLVTTATYQLSIAGLARRGLSETEAREAIASSARMLRAAVPEGVRVVGSIGPFGACLADGSEYRGDYRLTPDDAAAHFLPLIESLAPEVDLLAFETFPQRRELMYILEFLARRDLDRPPASISLSLRDPQTLADSTPLDELAPELMRAEGVFAIGVNCCPPEWVAPALRALRRHGDKALVAYPNLGDHGPSAYLEGRAPAQKFFDPREVRTWLKLGARIVGGCCGAGPAAIAELASIVQGQRES